MAKRETKKVISTATLPDAEAAMATVARVNSKLKSIEAKKELAKLKIDEQYQDEVNKLTAEKKEPLEILFAFAKEDVKNWKLKSYDLAGGTIGFRTNPPKLDKLKGFTWDAVTVLVKEHYPDYIRTKEEVDKDAIIALRDDEEIMPGITKKCKVMVVQDETFFVTTKEEELAAV